MLHSSNGFAPRFYALPKIHMSGIPLRLIVSFVNSPTDKVSFESFSEDFVSSCWITQLKTPLSSQIV